ncbi:MAG: hypothetical protein ACYC1L_18965 [Alphaproteobacteria bacterium]
MADQDKPVACTLGLGDFKTRIGWIREVNKRALRSHARDGLALRLTYAADAASSVRELVRRETACCGFLRFDVREEIDAVHLTITAPEEARVAAETMFEQFASR